MAKNERHYLAMHEVPEAEMQETFQYQFTDIADNETQISALRRIYNSLLRKKMEFIDEALKHEYKEPEINQLNIGLAHYTFRLQEVDAKINYMLTGRVRPCDNQHPQSIVWYANKFYATDKKTENRIKKLEKNIFKLTVENNNIQSKLVEMSYSRKLIGTKRKKRQRIA